MTSTRSKFVTTAEKSSFCWLYSPNEHFEKRLPHYQSNEALARY
jgi:hypothetical protein